MDIEKKFRTKTGFCHITKDQIILTRDGVIGNVSKVTVGNNITRSLILYGLISIGLIYLAYESYITGETTMTLFFSVIGLYLIYGIIKSRNNSAKPIIERKDITKVTFSSGTSGLTRPRFEIEFSHNGKVKKRLIMLPGTMNTKQNELDKILQIMKEEKLLN